MSTACFDIGFAEETKNDIRWLSVPTLGHWIIKITIGRQTKKFRELAEQVKEWDSVFVVNENFIQEDIIKIQELYYLVNSFYYYIAEINYHRFFEFKSVIGELANHMESINHKIEKHFATESLSDFSISSENRIIANKTLAQEWDNPQEDEVWNKFFSELK